MADAKRMQLRGLHHVTAICRDIEHTVGFYRDVLGMAVVLDGPSDDDPQARHVRFAAGDGSFVSFLHYPRMPEGVVGIGSTHHFALTVDTAEELHAWRDYLREQGVGATDVHDRGQFRAIYTRDPDGHVLEIATRWRLLGAGGPPA